MIDRLDLALSIGMFLVALALLILTINGGLA
jgi:hypothetical protein